MEFDGEKLRRLRKAKKLSLPKMAEAVRFITKRPTSPEAVRKWELKGVHPRADVLIALAELFELEPREFFTRG